MASARRRTALLLGGALLVLGAAFVATRGLDGPSVLSAIVERKSAIQTVLVEGRALPPAEVEVTPRIEALVVQVLVEEGQVVEAGTTLARLDRSELEVEVTRARAALARVRASSGRSRRIAPKVAEEQLASLQAQRKEAFRTLQQAESLTASGAWSRDRLAVAQDVYGRSQNAERSAELELRAARGLDRRAASAAVDEALAALALAEDRLAQAELISPVEGIVLERAIELGDTSRPGRRAFLLAAAGPPILEVNPDERHLAQLALGQRADIVADAYPDRAFNAEVSFIAPAIDPERGTVEVRLRSNDAVPFLRPQMTLSVEIEVARHDDALVIPSRFVVDAATERPTVWVIVDGKLARREIGLGLRGTDELEVVSGLEPGEVIVELLDPSLDEGDRVRVDR